MKVSIGETGLRVKLYNNLVGIGITHKESICDWREKVRVYGSRAGAQGSVLVRGSNAFLT